MYHVHSIKFLERSKWYMPWYTEFQKAWDSGEEGKILTRCDVCGQPIYEYEDYCEMPDGKIVCDQSDCHFKWLDKYKVKKG